MSSREKRAEEEDVGERERERREKREREGERGKEKLRLVGGIGENKQM